MISPNSVFRTRPGTHTVFDFYQKDHHAAVAQLYRAHLQRSHDIVRKNLEHSALYGGIIKGTSARYCPSFEDKIVKFPERERHQIILEPEGVDTEEIYASGLGNSLPLEVQTELVRSVEGLENAEIMRPAYAIEYDYINPISLNPPWKPNGGRDFFWRGKSTGPPAMKKRLLRGSGRALMPPAEFRGDRNLSWIDPRPIWVS